MTGLLLDTDAVVWFATGDAGRMPEAIAAMLSDPERDVAVSAASIWKLATKERIGKLSGVGFLLRDPARSLSRLGMRSLPITIDHAGLAGRYGVAHRDPFDRMLAAQAEIEGLALVSTGPALDAFGIERVWA